uniref:Sex-determining region Y protein n=2 Tax=Eptatretus burgeri TaxID=7764 RepID=A0A8C4QSR2_EPTBU
MSVTNNNHPPRCPDSRGGNALLPGRCPADGGASVAPAEDKEMVLDFIVKVKVESEFVDDSSSQDFDQKLNVDAEPVDCPIDEGEPHPMKREKFQTDVHQSPEDALIIDCVKQEPCDSPSEEPSDAAQLLKDIVKVKVKSEFIDDSFPQEKERETKGGDAVSQSDASSVVNTKQLNRQFTKTFCRGNRLKCPNSAKPTKKIQVAEQFSNKERRDRKGRIKRPMNAFMVFAQSHRRQMANALPTFDNASVSKALGEVWHSLREDLKRPYYQEARRLEEKQRKLFPDWVYRPTRKHNKQQQLIIVQKVSPIPLHSDGGTKFSVARPLPCSLVSSTPKPSCADSKTPLNLAATCPSSSSLPPPDVPGTLKDCEPSRLEPSSQVLIARKVINQERDDRKDHIKRPMNAFMVFAKSHRRQMANVLPNFDNAAVSKALGKVWHSLREDLKRPYYDQAFMLANEHKKMFPDWVYKPARKMKKQELVTLHKVSSAPSRVHTEDITTDDELSILHPPPCPLITSISNPFCTDSETLLDRPAKRPSISMFPLQNMPKMFKDFQPSRFERSSQRLLPGAWTPQPLYQFSSPKPVLAHCLAIQSDRHLLQSPVSSSRTALENNR